MNSRSEHQDRSRGFTMIESVTALAVAGVLLAALGSMLAMSLKAFPRPEADPSVDAASMQDAQVWLRDDLGSATSVVASSATMIEFRVADRDSDAVAETIRYWWTGDGDRLRRTINGAYETTLGPSLSDFVLTPWWRDTAVKSADAAMMGSDETIFRYPGASNATQSIGATLLSVSFVPVLQADATAWSVKTCRITISTSIGLAVGFRARLYTGAVRDLSAQTAIATAELAAVLGGLSNSAVTLTFSTTPEIAPGQLVTIVFDAPLALGRLGVHYNNASVPLSTMYASTGSGSTWTTMASGGAPITIVGTQKRPGIRESTESRLFGVGVVAVPKRSAALPARFAIGTPSEPKVE